MSKMKSFLNLFLKNPTDIVRTLGRNKVLNWIPDKTYIKLLYKNSFGKRINLKNPKTFNEKLQWLKLYDRKTEYITYVDKYDVRSYIEKVIGNEYLVPLIGVYENVAEIPWSKLPDKFVLKCTHGCGSNIICKNKKELNVDEAKAKLNKWIKTNYYWCCREWPYKNVRPRVICEQYISDKETTPDDYKVLCFSGKAKLIEVHIDRYGNHKQDFYDLNWNKTSISQEDTKSNQVNSRPKELHKMIELSELLTKDMIHARVDWYVVDEKLYFGEITLYDGSGLHCFDNEEDDYLLGSWIRLPI